MSTHPKSEGESQPMVKAYQNEEFMNGREGRIVRIMSEYLEPVDRLLKHKVDGAIVMFGSARIDDRIETEQALTALDGESDTPDIGRKRKILENRLRMSRYYDDAVSLAGRLTTWVTEQRENSESPKSYLICSGGGPGIMEAANRGAFESGGESIGLNISLPFEQEPNRYATPELNFEFHYFFMRKLFFMSLANAVVVFPGGFGTLDELMETLTLVQTGKVTKKMPIVLYGHDFWKNAVNFEFLVDSGVISPEDLDLFEWCDTVDDAFAFLTKQLASVSDEESGPIDPGKIRTDQ